MALDTRARMRTPFAADLSLPPPFTLVTLRESGDAFAHAMGIAGERGAGTLVYVGRFDLAEFAVVMEPEEPLRTARRAFYAGMAALADALIAQAPPDVPVTIDWPDALRVNGGPVGGGRLGWPPGVGEDETPPCVVFGAMIRTVSMGDQEAGLTPLATALEDEGFNDFLSNRLAEGFARRLMVAFDAWQERGFGAVSKAYLPRLNAEQGIRRDLDDNGDLLTRRVGKAVAERKPLLGALALPSWLDPKTGGPRR